jgi:hypothetical protein
MVIRIATQGPKPSQGSFFGIELPNTNIPLEALTEDGPGFIRRHRWRCRCDRGEFVLRGDTNREDVVSPRRDGDGLGDGVAGAKATMRG